MNKSVYFSFVVLFYASLLLVSCKKEVANEPSNGPAITYPTSGFLCTASNHAALGGSSTVMYFSSTNGQTAVGYLPGAGRPADEVSVVVNSNNTVSIQLKIPLRSGGRDYPYFRIQTNINPLVSSYPNNLYLFNWSETKTTETEFILKRSDADKLKFTLESKAYPGYFLGTGRWKNSTSKNDDNLIFSSKQQLFFFQTS
jgi:hypothetical protein